MTNLPYKIAPVPLTTPWADQVDPQLPWNEYPRPQMTRKTWQNLNGLWDYAITSRSTFQPGSFDGQILVPYPIESALSGVKRKLKPRERLWYRRVFTVNQNLRGGLIILHFGAVDWYCRVFINGVGVGEHTGGYDPFSFDITDYLLDGENQLQVSVYDPSDKLPIQRGKQVRKPGFIWYTAHSGIWQTVWLEGVPSTFIDSIKIVPDIDQGIVSIEAQISNPIEGLHLQARVFDQTIEIASAEITSPQKVLVSLKDFKTWSPEAPHLYDLKLALKNSHGTLDEVTSYFGMRKFSLAKDSKGTWRFHLNNEPYFLYGPLDQGYWPDGLSTPPTDEAIQWELNFIKQAGFNMLRKHIKVEPARYYYHCDRAGIIVWQDMISGGISPKPIWFLFAPRFLRLKDDRAYWRLGRQGAANRRQFRAEYEQMIKTLFNVVSIAIWGPFNEGWGQFDAAQIAELTQKLDPTRLVDHASGWFDQGAGHFKSDHIYFKPLPEPQSDPNRAWVLSEFGGYSLNLPDHVWNSRKDFGYKKFETIEALTQGYLELIENQLIPWVESGLSAAVYTQTTDVEIEVNGFLTYDRKAIKMDLTSLQLVHKKLFQIFKEMF